MKINLLPLILLISFDILNIHKIWNENVFRRYLHHNHGYNLKKNPEIYKIEKILDLETVNEILKLNFKDKKNMNNNSFYLSIFANGLYSKRSSLYLNDFDKNSKAYLEKISLKIKPKLENLCKKKLKLGKSDFRISLLRYEGINSNFGWHYDTEPKNCYRVLILIKKEGKIPLFCYKNHENKIVKINLNLSDAIFLKGTQTYHMVEKSIDENSVRWVLGFQYYYGNIPQVSRSLCSELRGKDKKFIFKFLLKNTIPYLILLQILTKLLPKIYIDFKFYFIISSIFLLLSKKLPKYLPLSFGTGNILDFKQLFISNLFLFIYSGNPISNYGFSSYLYLTETLLPSSIISKTLINGGS